MSARQQYRPIENRDIDESAGGGGRSHGFKVRRLRQDSGTETPKMRSAMKYERGRKNVTRS